MPYYRSIAFISRFIVAVIVALTISFTALAADITVDAACSLQDAVTSADLDMAEGSCTAGSGADTITITAAGAASGTITLSEPLHIIRSEITINGGGFTIDGNDSVQIFGLTTDAADLTIRDLTIINANVSNLHGGAIEMEEGTLFLSRVTFRDNTSLQGGAISAINSASVTIHDSTFSGNSAPGPGGAISIEDSTLIVLRSTFSNNSSTGSTGGTGAGGAIHVSHSASGSPTILRVTDSAFTSNQADETGGAIHTQNRVGINVWITNSAFFGNTAGDSGGAIRNETGAVITGSSFVNNVATANGGAIWHFNDELQVDNSTFYNNQADDGLPGLGTAYLGESGGAIFTSDQGDSQVRLRHVTMLNNVAALGGGGIYLNNNTTEFDLSNSIIAGSAVSDCYSARALHVNINNLIEDGSCAAMFSGDPLLATPPVGSPAYLLPMAGSPVFDAAPNDVYCLPADQRGTARPIGSGCDLGAIESASSRNNGTSQSDEPRKSPSEPDDAVVVVDRKPENCFQPLGAIGLICRFHEPELAIEVWGVTPESKGFFILEVTQGQV